MTNPTWEWVGEHYRPSEPTEVTEDGRRWLRCRRCNRPVGYLTKHAVVRHGDPIDIIPVQPVTARQRGTAAVW